MCNVEQMNVPQIVDKNAAVVRKEAYEIYKNQWAKQKKGWYPRVKSAFNPYPYLEIVKDTVCKDLNCDMVIR